MSDAPRELYFVLPFALDSLNVRDRRHRYQHGQDKKSLNLEVLAAIGGPRYKPFPPWKRVRISVVRCSSGTLDRDNLFGSVKNLLDVLCAQSSSHPSGLGIIEDDRDDLVVLDVTQSTAPPGRGTTAVKIASLPDTRSTPPKKTRPRKSGEPRFLLGKRATTRAHAKEML